jgi:hypothetical protein
VALRWDHAAAWELIDDGALRSVASSSAPDLARSGFAAAGRGIRLQRGEGLPGRVCASGRPARIPDRQADPSFPSGRCRAACGVALRAWASPSAAGAA